MKTIQALAIGLVFSTFSVISAADPASFDPEIIEYSTQIASDAIDAGTPGLQIALSRGDQIWVHSSGFSDIENGIRMQDSTPIRSASLSKSITYAAVMKLVRSGHLGLDNTIDPLLPDTIVGDLPNMNG